MLVTIQIQHSKNTNSSITRIFPRKCNFLALKLTWLSNITNVIREEWLIIRRFKIKWIRNIFDSLSIPLIHYLNNPLIKKPTTLTLLLLAYIYIYICAPFLADIYVMYIVYQSTSQSYNIINLLIAFIPIIYYLRTKKYDSYVVLKLSYLKRKEKDKNLE